MEEGTQQAHQFKKQVVVDVTFPYLLYLPKGYEEQETKRWPLLLFLHGAGERGNDLAAIRAYGPPRLIDQGQELPFIVVSPQCSRKSWWSMQTAGLTALLEEIEEHYRVDSDRIYVTGLSMGGMGTWALAIANHGKFAAIVPICGGDDPEAVHVLKNVPVWAFHGAKDNVVPLSASEQMVEALRASGGNVKFTVYPEAGHDSWTQTYNNPELFPWLLEQHKVSK